MKIKLKKKNDLLVTELDLPFFNHIVHLSDIHIRPLRRHDEFQKVFETTLAEIKKIPQSIIALTGDLFDNKTTFHPETFLLGRNLLKDLAKIAPVLVIAGNHDMYENNQNRLDSITPIAEDILNLYYLKQSGLYYVPSRNYCFVVSSLSDKQFIRRKDIVEREGYKYLALYHGAVTGTQTDMGYDIKNDDAAEGSSRYRTLADFAGFDAVLLGDIHKHQVRKVPERENAYLAYAGSLIQQNHGETRHGHGILIWDAELTCKLKEIPNEYGFADIYCENGVWTNDFIVLPKKCYARLIIKNSTEEHINVIQALLKTRTEWLFIEKRQCLNDIIKESEIPPDVQRIDDEADLIKQMADAADIDQLLAQHRLYQSELDQATKHDMNTAVWKPVRLEFQNLFGYGGDIVNRIDFTTGVTCISAANARGKTSFVNILLFGIFGKTLLNPSGSSFTFDIVNTGYSNGYVNLLMNYGGGYYVIERKSVKKKVSTKAVMSLLNNYEFTCHFWRSDETGALLENLQDIKRKNTDTAIVDLFGDITDFALANLLNKESQVDLLTMTPAEQIRTLKRIFRLEVYDQYRELNKGKLAGIETQIATLIREKQQCEALVSIKPPELPTEDGEDFPTVLAEMTENLENLFIEKKGVQAEIVQQKEKMEPVHPATEKSAESLPMLLKEQKRLSHCKDTGMSCKALAYKIGLLKQEPQEPVEPATHPEAGNYTLAQVQIKIDRLSIEFERIAVDTDPFPAKTLAEIQADIKAKESELRPVHTNFQTVEQKLEAYNEEDLYTETIIGGGPGPSVWKTKTEKEMHMIEQQMEDLSRRRSNWKPRESRETLVLKLIETPYKKPIPQNEADRLTLEKEWADLTQKLKKGERGRIQRFIDALRTQQDLEIGMKDALVAYLEEKHSGKQDSTISSSLERIKQLEYDLKVFENTTQINATIVANQGIEAEIAELDYRASKAVYEQLQMDLLIMDTQHCSTKAYTEFQELQKEYALHRDNQAVEKVLKRLNQSWQWKKAADIGTEIKKFKAILAALEYNLYLLYLSKQAERVQIEAQYDEQLDYEKYVKIKEQISIRNNEKIRAHICTAEDTVIAIETDIQVQQAELKVVQEKYNRFAAQLQLADYKRAEYEKHVNRLNALSVEIIAAQKELQPLEAYARLMSNRGIPCKLLYMKIKAIESYINRIIETFTKYRVHILYDDVKQSMTILTENTATGEHLSIQRLSGFEKLMLQVAFKRALNKFSYNSKSSLIIIDEALDCIDNENFQSKLPEIMNMIAQDYAIAIAISQRDISHISDRSIKINTENGYSKLLV
jgi:DNA repair exonuclease SbcCD ATPase subunit/DNA repair exonuclease SbcCD nuclease subunit